MSHLNYQKIIEDGISIADRRAKEQHQDSWSGVYYPTLAGYLQGTLHSVISDYNRLSDELANVKQQLEHLENKVSHGCVDGFCEECDGIPQSSDHKEVW